MTGLKVAALTADGASANRSFFKMHAEGSQCNIHKVINRYADDERYVYVISDVPHLLKTAHNAFANSFDHSFSWKLWVITIIIITTINACICAT